MPGIEFTTLTAQELRSLEGALRRREQSALADEVAAELATRGRRAPQWGGGALRTADGPHWTETREAEAAPRRAVPVALAASAAAVLGVGVGWTLTRAPDPAPTVLPVVVSQPQSPAPPQPAATLVPTLPTTPQPTVSALPPPQPVRSSLPAAEANVPEPAPARRLSDEQRLLRAYEKAMATGVDPRIVDRAQARWRQRLERAGGERRGALYERRIRELERLAGG